MHECTFEIFFNEEKQKDDWRMYRGMWVRGMMGLESWNSLVLLKNLGYEI